MVKRFRVVTIALLGANNVMKKHGEIVTKEDLTGSIDELLTEGFIEEVKECDETLQEEVAVETEAEADEVLTEVTETTETEETEVTTEDTTDEVVEVVEETLETTETETSEDVAVETEVETTTEISANPLVDKLKNNKKK